jgi:pantothenate kinase type III
MKLEIDILNSTVKLSIKKNGVVISQLRWEEENNLSEKLLAKIDELLKANSFKSVDIKSISVKADVPVGYTTERIARSVAKAFNYAIKKETA